MKVPAFLLKKLYVKNSLHNTDTGFEFKIKNTLMDATITSPVRLTIDNRPIPQETITITAQNTTFGAADVSENNALPLKVNVEVTLSVEGKKLDPGEHEIEIASATKEYGDIQFSVTDTL